MAMLKIHLKSRFLLFLFRQNRVSLICMPAVFYMFVWWQICLAICNKINQIWLWTPGFCTIALADSMLQFWKPSPPSSAHTMTKDHAIAFGCWWWKVRILHSTRSEAKSTKWPLDGWESPRILSPSLPKPRQHPRPSAVPKGQAKQQQQHVNH